jgi:MoaD family protein
MAVTVKFYATIKNVTKSPEVSVEMGKGTIGDIMNMLGEKYGKDFRDIIFDKNGCISRNIKMLLNTRLVDAVDGSDTPVSDGDTVYLFPAIGGG